MADYLFSQNILIFFTVLSSVLCFLFLRGYRWFSGKPYRAIIAISAAGATFAVEILAIDHWVGLDNTPSASYYTVCLLNILLGLLVAYPKRGKRHWLFGSAAVLSVAILSGIIINAFYQYYPTISSIFEPPNHANTEILTRTRSPSGQHSTHTIEGQLFASGVSRGRVTSVNIPGRLSGLQTRDGYIYTPPAYYDASFAKVKFPVLLLLTGTPGNPSSWLQNGTFVHTMDDFASHHAGITPIVAIVDHSGSFANDTECLNSAHGNAETYLTQDVPAYLTSHYRVSGSPSNWGIGGFSEGGMCAAMLTLIHQDVFRHFLDLSGDPYPFLNNRSQTLPVLFHGSRAAQTEHNIDWLIAHHPLSPDLTGQLAIGADDSRALVAEMRHTYALANKRHMTISLELMQNQGHTFGFWSRAYSDALPALSYYLGATECQTVCTN